MSESLQELHRELVEDFAANPERWLPSDPAGEEFRGRINRVLRAIKYGTTDDINRSLAAFVRYCRLERGENVVDFPSAAGKLNLHPVQI